VTEKFLLKTKLSQYIDREPVIKEGKILIIELVNGKEIATNN
jgi:hypothetical protein